MPLVAAKRIDINISSIKSSRLLVLTNKVEGELTATIYIAAEVDSNSGLFKLCISDNLCSLASVRSNLPKEAGFIAIVCAGRVELRGYCLYSD